MCFDENWQRRAKRRLASIDLDLSQVSYTVQVHGAVKRIRILFANLLFFQILTFAQLLFGFTKASSFEQTI